MKEMSGRKMYEPGYILKENEYMLKIRNNENGTTPTGFISKLNKDGSFPKAFDEWGIGYHYYSVKSTDKLPIYVVEETFREGWKLESWRFGESRNWATVVHPDGYTLEIYLSQFLDIVKENTIVNGLIHGSFKWERKNLVKFVNERFNDEIVDKVLLHLSNLSNKTLTIWYGANGFSIKDFKNEVINQTDAGRYYIAGWIKTTEFLNED